MPSRHVAPLAQGRIRQSSTFTSTAGTHRSRQAVTGEVEGKMLGRPGTAPFRHEGWWGRAGRVFYQLPPAG